MPKRKDDWLPKEKRETLICKECKEELPIASFIKRGRNKQGHMQFDSRCKDCSSVHRKTNWQSYGTPTKLRQAKAEYLKEVKTQCLKCGYDGCSAALDFHHTDEDTKNGGIAELEFSGKISLEVLQEEVAKCIVLCCRCHRELHAGVWNIKELRGC